MSLFSILNDLFESSDHDSNLAFVFDDGSSSSSSTSSSNQKLKYSDLKSKLNLLRTGFSNLRSIILPFLPFKQQPTLYAFLYKHWNRSFFELLLSAIFSKSSFFIIDHEWPEKYIVSILSQIKPEFIIFDSETTNLSLYSSLIQSEYEKITDSILTECHIIRCRCARLTRDPDLAYIISTSGTTGLPKIIEVCNSSIVPNIVELSKSDVVFQASPLTFDPSLIELFCSLYSKSTLLVVPKILKLMPARLGNILDQNNVTFLQLTPTLFKNLKPYIVKLEKLKRIILGGENFPRNDEAIKKLVIDSNVQVYNIYGITELSCWSSLHLVTRHDLENENSVPVVGKILNETKLFLKTEDESNILDIDELISKNETCFQGVLLHSSNSRKCFINGEVRKYAESGDRALVSGGKVYLKGRDDRVVKINGKLTDLNLLEQTVKNVSGVSNCISCVHHENFISLFVFTNSIENLSEIINNHIKSSLPGHYEPRKLIVLDDQNIPFTTHGKIDAKKLSDIYLEKQSTNHLNLKDILKDLWKKWIQVEPNHSDNFITSGGDSLKAIGFIADLEIEIKQRDYNLRTNHILDVLLNESFSNLERTLFHGCGDREESVTELSRKRRKIDDSEIKTEIEKPSMSKSIICCYTKCSRYVRDDDSNWNCFWCDRSKYSIQFDWRVDTKKCVDASPLVVASDDNNIRILIGSHSHEFICVDGLTGRLIWTFLANDRIEASACLSKCGSYVIFGSYDKNVYVLDIENGSLIWHIETNDVVKSSPCIDLETGYVFFGSHDKHLYCVDIESRNLIWKKALDESSIFAGPTCDHESNVFVSTLGGSLYSLNKNKGTTNWKYTLDKATFTSPIYNKSKTCVYIGTCGGTFYCISFDGLKIWEFKVNEPIFSNACLVEEETCVLFGCHDKSVYCLNQSDGKLKWTSNLMSEIYSSPFCLEPSKVLCISCDGLLRLLSLNGNVELEEKIFEQNNMCYSSPIIYQNRLYVGSRDNHLYSFKII